MTVAELIAQECRPATRAVWDAVRSQTEESLFPAGDGVWLAGGEALCAATGLAWPTVNKHLAALERLGVLIRYGRVGYGGGTVCTTHLMLVAAPDHTVGAS